MRDIKIFLENSVYYPACAFDGTPIKFLGKLFTIFFMQIISLTIMIWKKIFL